MKKSKGKVSKSAIIRKLHDEGRTPKEIKHYVKCSPALIGVVLSNYKKKKAKGGAQFKSPRSRLIQDVFQMKKALDVVESKALEKIESKPTKLLVQPRYKLVQPRYEDGAMKILADNDLVNHPPHYTKGGIEYWDFAEAKGLTENAYLFNAGKYIVRCGKKEGADPIQDLEKAIKFIQRDIDRRKRA